MFTFHGYFRKFIHLYCRRCWSYEICTLLRTFLTEFYFNRGSYTTLFGLSFQTSVLNDVPLMHQSIPDALSPPSPGYCGAFARLSRGWGIRKFCTARGPGICQPQGHFRAFDTLAVFYENITTQKVLVEKMQIGPSSKDRNKLKRVVKACSRFYACISSRLIKQEFIHSGNRSCRCESTFFGYWI